MDKKLLFFGICLILVVLAFFIGYAKIGFFGVSFVEKNKIGAIIPLSGELAYMGESMQKGIGLAIKDTNFNISIIYEDFQGKKDVAVNAYNKLTQLDNVNYIFGSQSGVILSYSPLAKEQHKIVFAIGTANPGLTTNNGFLFRNNLYTADEAEFNAKQIFNLGYKNIILIAHNQPGGKEYLNIFSEKYKGDVLFQEVFQNSLDFKDIALKIKNSKADAVFVYSYSSELAELMKESYSLGLNTNWFSLFCTEENAIRDLPKNVKEGLVYSYPINYKNNQYSEFSKNYFEEYGIKPDLFAALAYDNIQMLKLAMEGCDYKDVTCVKNNLLKIENFNGVSGETTIDAEGDSHKQIYLKTIKNGEFVMFGE